MISLPCGSTTYTDVNLTALSQILVQADISRRLVTFRLFLKHRAYTAIANLRCFRLFGMLATISTEYSWRQQRHYQSPTLHRCYTLP